MYWQFVVVFPTTPIFNLPIKIVSNEFSKYFHDFSWIVSHGYGTSNIWAIFEIWPALSSLQDMY